MLYSLDDSYVGPSESTYYESTDKDATATVMDAYSKSTVTVTGVYSEYVYGWET